MPMNEAQYFEQRAEADARAAGAAEKRRLRKSRESGAARGTLYSGVQTRREGEIMSETDEQMRQASLDREMERYNAYQRDLDRSHQMSMQESQQTWGTGEREGSQAWQGGQAAEQRNWQTGERTGTQDWTTGERMGTQEFQSAFAEQQASLQSRLQAQSEQARMELEALVQSGSMSELQFQTAWQAEQSKIAQQWEAGQADLDRQLQEWQSTGQWGHEAGMQQGQFGQEQWMAGFGAEHDVYMADMANQFEQGMAIMGQDWAMAQNQWNQYMFNLDTQLQLTLDGFNWGQDSYNFLGTQNAADVEQPSGYYDLNGIWHSYYPQAPNGGGY